MSCGDTFPCTSPAARTTLVWKVDALQGDATSWEATISADGTTVGFQSSADNLVPGDSNTQADVFTVNLSTHAGQLNLIVDDLG